MEYQSSNPYTRQVLQSFPTAQLPDLKISQNAYQQWRKLTLNERATQLKKVAAVIEKNKEKYARTITLEMGKPYREALYEINKVLTAFDYYNTSAEALLQAIPVTTAASSSYISFEPLGIIFSIMPWNFPFWQVFRFAVPTLMAGNVTILKHAPSVPQCAGMMEEIFAEAGVLEGIFKNYYLSNEDAELLIAHPAMAGVSFTGSDGTGAIIASIAGKHIKKCVIELGGNDPFIVLADADIDLAVAGAIKSRSINSGQSCNAAKRFIIVEEVYEQFAKKLKEAVMALVVGDPMNEATQIGPLARYDLAVKVRGQISATIEAGAVATTNKYPADAQSCIVAPAVLEQVRPGMVAFEQEIFGPVWTLIMANSEKEAISLANQSIYGLGASIWTSDAANAISLIPQLETGNVFVNDIVKSDARLPFGGIKRSGFGRELSDFGLKEFVNIKTVFIK